MIVVVGGGPRAGKSTLALELALRSGTELLRTDDLISLGWSECSQEVAARILTARSDLIVEGVAAWRALRKALELTAGPPCHRVVIVRHLEERLTATSYQLALQRDATIALTARQRAMAAGCNTVLEEIWPELVARGVAIERL